jgi:hypothetical protein
MRGVVMGVLYYHCCIFSDSFHLIVLSFGFPWLAPTLSAF